MRMVGLPSVERTEAAAEEMEEGEERSHLKKRTVGGAVGCQYRRWYALCVWGNRTFVREFLHVQNGNLDALLGQQVDDDLSDTIATSRHDDNLLAPHICVVAPVVGHCFVKPCAHASQHAQPREHFEVLQETAMLFAEDVALCGVAREEDQRKGERRVERRVAEEARDSVARHTCKLCQQSRRW